MLQRPKILIVEHDDFLREILGNLLHKKGNYILSGFCIEKTLEEAAGKHIHLVILGTSCERYEGEKTIHYLRKRLGEHLIFYLINHQQEPISFLGKEHQIAITELSIQKIIHDVTTLLGA